MSLLTTVVYANAPRTEGLQRYGQRRGSWPRLAREALSAATFVLTPKNGRMGRIQRALPGFTVDEITTRNGAYYVADRDDTVPESRLYVPPEPFHGSPRSQALYYASRRTGRRALLIQELSRMGDDRYAATSCHHHTRQHEIWIALQGSVSVLWRPVAEPTAWHIEQISADAAPTLCILGPGTVHQLRSAEYSLVYLLMDGCPEHDNFYADHHYNDPPPTYLI